MATTTTSTPLEDVYSPTGEQQDPSAPTGVLSGPNTTVPIETYTPTVPENPSPISPETEAYLSYKAPETLSAKAGSYYNTPSTTVAYQLKTLLDSNNEYMKQSEAKAKMTADSLGMLSSDRYVGAARGASIREALPIATADAGTAVKFQQGQQAADATVLQTQQEGLVSGSLKSQGFKIDLALKDAQNKYDTIMAANAYTNNIELTKLQTKLKLEADKELKAMDQSLQAAQNQFNLLLSREEWAANKDIAELQSTLTVQANTALKNLDAQIAKDVADKNYDFNTAENTRNQAVSQIQNTMISIENTLKSPDILLLGPEAVSSMINNQISLMRGGVELTYKLAGLGVDSYVTSLLDNYEQTYKFDVQYTTPADTTNTTDTTGINNTNDEAKI